MVLREGRNCCRERCEASGRAAALIEAEAAIPALLLDDLAEREAAVQKLRLKADMVKISQLGRRKPDKNKTALLLNCNSGDRGRDPGYAP
jgi:hypothetical protein